VMSPDGEKKLYYDIHYRKVLKWCINEAGWIHIRKARKTGPEIVRKERKPGPIQLLIVSGNHQVLQPQWASGLPVVFPETWNFVARIGNSSPSSFLLIPGTVSGVMD